MAHEVVRTIVAPRPIAVLTATTTWQEYPRVWRQLLDGMHANIRWGGTGHKGRNVMLYHDDVPRVEVGVELDQPAEFDEPVIQSALPAGEVAMTVHHGPFEDLGAPRRTKARAGQVEPGRAEPGEPNRVELDRVEPGRVGDRQVGVSA